MTLKALGFIRWLAVFVALAVAAPASAQDAIPPADATAIQQVIQSQLNAFQHDDWQTAFGYAAPSIQSIFGSPEGFSQMVRGGYPQVYRPKAVEFRELSSTQFGPTQRVFVVGPDGHSYMAFYTMEQQPDGTWRISGCHLVELEDQSV